MLIEWSLLLAQIGGSKIRMPALQVKVWGPTALFPALSDKTEIKSCVFSKMGLTATRRRLQQPNAAISLLRLFGFLGFVYVIGTNVPHVSGVKITSEGGYTDLVIKIRDEVPEDDCPEILGNLKVSAPFFPRKCFCCFEILRWIFVKSLPRN